MIDGIELVADRDDVLAAWDNAAKRLSWTRPYDSIHDPDRQGHGSWFPGGQINLCGNALDRHLEDRADTVAIQWEGEPGDRRALTYGDLHAQVTALADALVELGVSPGDRVVIFMGLVPEAIEAMLACARIGAVHAALPSVLPTEALVDRLNDLRPRVFMTQDGAWRHGMVVPLKSRADDALTAVTSVEHTIVTRRTGMDVPWYEGDHWYEDLLAGARQRGTNDRSEPRPLRADHPALVTYVANRRGRPTGLVHRTGGLAVYCQTVHVDGFTTGPDDVIWAPGEIGWIASETHGFLGPLLAGSTAVIYEGMLDTPDPGRAWDIMERYDVNALLVTPSVLRALQRSPVPAPNLEQVASLHHVITLGEPVDEATTQWLRKDATPPDALISDAWGQAELAGAVTVTPGTGSRAGLPPAGLEIVDATGAPVPDGTVGDLVLRHPWPSTALGMVDSDDVPGADPDRPGVFVTNDRAVRRTDGPIRFLGRSDPVFNVSGQLVSATEVSDVLEEHPFVKTAWVMSQPHPRKGHVPVACVRMTFDVTASEELAAELRGHVHQTLGGLAEPGTVMFLPPLADDIEGTSLWRALENLCAEGRTTVHVTEEQLRAALLESQ